MNHDIACTLIATGFTLGGLIVGGLIAHLAAK